MFTSNKYFFAIRKCLLNTIRENLDLGYFFDVQYILF